MRRTGSFPWQQAGRRLWLVGRPGAGWVIALLAAGVFLATAQGAATAGAFLAEEPGAESSAVAEGTSGSPAQQIVPGSTVVVCRPTPLKIQTQVLAQLLAGTELQVEQIQGDELWVAYQSPERAKEEKERVIHGWVLRSDVIPGPGGEYWWLRMLPPDLQAMVRRGAREALKDKDWQVRR
ncbi:MAG TPA: hypothetical protein PLQ00_12040, partial [Thermoguttaceae bacterium]|nr:hypothetical protein [Thermoguttaceae bacterium]